jgi:hypothetical protein
MELSMPDNDESAKTLQEVIEHWAGLPFRRQLEIGDELDILDYATKYPFSASFHEKVAKEVEARGLLARFTELCFAQPEGR